MTFTSIYYYGETKIICLDAVEIVYSYAESIVYYSLMYEELLLLSNFMKCLQFFVKFKNSPLKSVSYPMYETASF